MWASSCATERVSGAARKLYLSSGISSAILMVFVRTVRNASASSLPPYCAMCPRFLSRSSDCERVESVTITGCRNRCKVGRGIHHRVPSSPSLEFIMNARSCPDHVPGRPRFASVVGVVGMMAVAGGGSAGFAPSGSSQDAHATFTVGTASAGRGQRALGVLKVPAGSDAGYDMPVAVIHGARPGPVLAVASGAHGSEYASILAVERLIDAVNPAEVSGTLVLLPLINVPSFEKITPHVNPTDNKSMNRFYPGDPNGTQTDRASFVVTKEVVERCDHLIDLHGGDLDENLRPYSYWTVTGNQKQDALSRAMVLAFGLDHIIISADRPKDPKASRYLENTASTRGKPSFTAEAGRSGPVDPKDAAVLVTGVQNVMGHLKMLARAA